MALLKRGRGAVRRYGGTAVVLLSLVTQVACSCHLVAQTLGAPNSPGAAVQPAWLTEWSPLSGIADLPRELPGAGTSLPSLLTLPAPRVGLFWTGGNPGALPFDVVDSYAQIRSGYDRHSGDYRRPLDAGTDSRSGGAALGWRTLAENGAAIGRLVAERLHLDDGAHADVVLPFSSNPFTVLDTLGDAVAGTVIRLEGAGGWRLGGLGIGLGVGYDGREVRTVESPVPRIDRVSTSGVTGGLAYDLADGALRLGVFGRREQMAQEVTLHGHAGTSLAYTFSGYYEPIHWALEPGGVAYWRRFDRLAWAYGTSVGGRVRGVLWTVFAQVERVTEEQYIHRFDNEPPTDGWDADGWSIGFAAQRFLNDSTVLVTVSGKYARLDGQAERMELGEANFTVHENAAHVNAEVRVLPHTGWGVALQFGVRRERRDRRDLLARIGSDLKHWAPGVSVEIARSLPFGLAVSVAGGVSQYAPWGSMPRPDRMSEEYQAWVAPELSLYGSNATTKTGCLTVLWRARERLSVWARGELASLSPDVGIGRLSFTPDGSRTRGRMEVGVTMGH